MITILEGHNGSGKTNIMNAVTWCLYGKEMHLEAGEKNFPTINTKALLEKPHGMINMHVKLVLADKYGEKFRIERELVLHSNGMVHIVYDEQTGLLIPAGSVPVVNAKFYEYEASKGWASTEYVTEKVRHILPEDLASYFLFDGEKLEDFFEQVENIKRGIVDVSQIQITQRTVQNLEKLAKEIRKAANKNIPKLKETEQNLTNVENDLDSVKKQIQHTVEDLDTKRKELRDVESVLAQSQVVGNYQKRINNLNHTIKRLKDDIEEKEEKRAKHVLTSYYSAMAFPAIYRTLNHIKKKSDEGVLPVQVRDTFIRDLLDRNTCICGNNLSDGTLARNKVSNLSKSLYAKTGELYIEIRFQLNNIINEINTKKSDLEEIERGLVGYKDSLDEANLERKDLEEKIGNVDVQYIKEIHNRKISIEKTVEVLNRKYGSLSIEKDRLAAALKLRRSEYDRELEKKKMKDYLDRRLAFCNTAYKYLDKIKNELLGDVRCKVEDSTDKYFLQLLWKKNTYTKVTIDEDYNMTAHHVDGYEVRDSLSKGEKLLLALSFMAALRSVTGFRFPLMIDTPLGRVSGEPSHNIATLLPRILQGSQIIILVTDSEYKSQIQDDASKQKFPPIRDTIKQYVGADYDIIFKDDKSEVIMK